MNFEKPYRVIRRCLEFEACRYDGQIVQSPLVQELKYYWAVENEVRLDQREFRFSANGIGVFVIKWKKFFLPGIPPENGPFPAALLRFKQ